MILRNDAYGLKALFFIIVSVFSAGFHCQSSRGGVYCVGGARRLWVRHWTVLGWAGEAQGTSFTEAV